MFLAANFPLSNPRGSQERISLTVIASSF